MGRLAGQFFLGMYGNIGFWGVGRGGDWWGAYFWANLNLRLKTPECIRLVDVFYRLPVALIQIRWLDSRNRHLRSM